MSALVAGAVAVVAVVGLVVGPDGPPVPVRRPVLLVPADRPDRNRFGGWRTEISRRALAGPLKPWHERRREAQLPAALERMAAGIRAGQSLSASFLAVAGDTPEPLGAELAARAASVRSGGAFSHAMEMWAADPSTSAGCRQAATALAVGAGTGGAVARAVDQVATSLRQAQQVQAEARALASQARASAALLAVAPLGFTALVATVEPDVIAFLTTTAPGLGCLLAGLALEAIGIRWMARIVGEER